MTVPIHEQASVQGGNSVFESLWITDTLHCNFRNSGSVGFSTITVDGAASFASDVSFAGDITLDEITCRNADVTGIATVKDLVIKEKLRDGDGAFGTAVEWNDTFLTSGDLHDTAASGECTPGNSPADGDMLIIEIERDTDDAADTYTEAARFWGIHLEYKRKLKMRISYNISMTWKVL